MKPIWYFVGVLLVIMGGIITAEGVRLVLSPSGKETVLGSTHPDIWWGGFMFLAGLAFVLRNRKRRVADSSPVE